MKAAFSVVVALSSLMFSSASANETLELTARKHEVRTHETILVRTPESPANIKIRFPSFRARSVCAVRDAGTETSRPDSSCVREELRYSPETEVLTIHFRDPRKLRGEKEFYVLRTPSQGGSSAPISLERTNTVHSESFVATKRRAIRVFGGETPRGIRKD